MNQLKFSKEAQEVLRLIEEGQRHLFVTGEAGTGKSTLLEHIVSEFGKKMVVLAPTGIAAINVKGSTIHSFFRLKPGYELDEAANMVITKSMTDRYSTVDTLLIDEVSMIRADVFDAMDVFLRRVRKSKDHFGGVRLILFGDLYQLPPVLTRNEEAAFSQNYESPWFFSARIFQTADLFSAGFELQKVQLRTIYRQKDQRFVEMLNAVRNKTMNAADLNYLDGFLVGRGVEDPGKKGIYLVGTNEQAARINAARLLALPGDVVLSKALEEGSVGKALPNADMLTMKKGARIMFLNNDQERRWVNGSLGYIVDFHDYGPGEEREVEVLLDTGKTVYTGQHTWPISRYRFKKGQFVREEIGSFTQLPFKLAWAITIHKSQGLTFNRLLLDLGGGSFAHGQCYVALSRCTGPEALQLKRPIRPSDVILDKRIGEFLQGS